MAMHNCLRKQSRRTTDLEDGGTETEVQTSCLVDFEGKQ